MAPGSNTDPSAISDDGTVIGRAGYNGFVRSSAGTVTQFTTPGAGFTMPLAINARDTITGYYYDGSFNAHSFLRASDGTITEFDLPGGYTSTLAYGIDGRGDVAGYGWNGSDHVGFIRKADGTFTTFTVPNCPQTLATAMNKEGTVVGECFGSDQIYYGFKRTADGTIITFSAPHAGTSEGDGTYPTAISANGKSIGEAYDDSYASYGYRLTQRSNRSFVTSPTRA